MRSKRPDGHITRGKTALNRLRQVDTFVALALGNTLIGGAPLLVDLGYGAFPWTALEMLSRLRRVNPAARLLGVEIDPARVAAAQPYADVPQVNFRLGGFDLQTLLNGERARYIRAYNVLRQYEEVAVAPALVAMSAALEPGGILIEGTCNPTGRVVVFDVYRKVGITLTHEALVFGTNFRAPAAPEDFRAVLPKRLIHHALDSVPAAFFATWQRAYLQSRHLPTREAWIAAGNALRADYAIDPRRGLLRRGFLTLRAALT